MKGDVLVTTATLWMRDGNKKEKKRNISSSRLNSFKPTTDREREKNLPFHFSVAKRQKQRRLVLATAVQQTCEAQYLQVKESTQSKTWLDSTRFQRKKAGWNRKERAREGFFKFPFYLFIFIFQKNPTFHVLIRYLASAYFANTLGEMRSPWTQQAGRDKTLHQSHWWLVFFPPQWTLERRKDNARYLLQQWGMPSRRRAHGSEFSDRICVPAVEYCGMAKRKVGGKPC